MGDGRVEKMTEDEAEEFVEKWRDQNSADLAKIEEREDAEGGLLVMDGKGEYPALGIHDQARRKRARAEQRNEHEQRFVQFKP